MVARMAAPATNHCLQPTLQSAVQSVNWTYSLFWQFCPQQRILVWGEGYYNGPIKTRKTVQPMEVSTEEASLHRSEQLRELYDSLSAGETNQPARRPSAALSPEDLTESEWFYLMCVSFTFPPGVGLPGKAYAKQKHVWLIGASEVDSKIFARAILAKTVVCIPLLDGVVELGTTEKVPEDIGLVQRIKSFFTENNVPIPPKPALSGHSTSNTVMSPTLLCAPIDPLASATDRMDTDDDDDEEEEEEEGDDNEEDGDGEEVESDTEVDNGSAHDHVVAEPNELMHLDLSEDIRVGSPEDDSNILDSDFDHLLGASQAGAVVGDGQAGRVDSYRAVSTHQWPALDYCDDKPFGYSIPLQESGDPPLEESAIEDTHYSTTVSTILNHQSNIWSDSSSDVYSLHPTQSAFANWTPTAPLPGPTESTSQWVLKYNLITVPLLHTNSKSRDGAAPAESAIRFRKGTLQDELSANHVLAERRRREKLNERFIILRSLVPFVTKMDKASILGDTIEYLKQLRKKIQDLETRARLPELDFPSPDKKKKFRALEGCSVGKPRKSEAVAQVEVSIIESDALVEMRCPYMEGLLLDVMQVLREMRVEITAVQSSLNGGIFVAEMRAKVKENVKGKKVSIMEVKRAINQIISHR